MVLPYSSFLACDSPHMQLILGCKSITMKKILQNIFWASSKPRNVGPVMKTRAIAHTPEAFPGRRSNQTRLISSPVDIYSTSPERKKDDIAPCGC
jgi:hypothetical protein